jgi:hypothetical protein
MFNARFLCSFAGILLATSLPAFADEQGYIERFRGSWTGTGTVIKNAVPLGVNCNVVGTPADNHLVIDGTCSLAIFSVEVGADIVYDPASKRYSGTYIGADAGPAHISGRRNGAAVNLVVTWQKPINGDTRAHMVIENAGAGKLRMTTYDNVVEGGPEVMTSDTILDGARSLALAAEQ